MLAEAHRNDNKKNPGNGGQMSVLYVEDDPDHVYLVMRSFKENLFHQNVFHVSDGKEALDYLFHKEAFADADAYPIPRLVLLDLRLPKIDGLEVLELIKSSPKTRNIPVVVMTSSSSHRDIERAYALGANSFITKPLEFIEFQELMKDLGVYWLQWNQTSY